MTKLSPAQKVLDAFNERHELCWPFDDDWFEQCLAAALEAVADEVVPPAVILEYYERNESPVLGKAIEVRNNLLAIAAELHGTTTNQKDNLSHV